MVVCSFFQQGRCKFGDRCKYEHPGRGTAGSSGNRFGVLSGGFGGQAPTSGQQTADFGVTANDIKLDLTAGKGRPEWIFSAYAPSSKVPRQLFGGPQREQSMEEMRLRHYEAAAAGNMNQAVQEAQALWQEAVKQMDVALNDPDGAVKYIIDGANEHPNRLDICQGKTSSTAPQAAPFSQPSAAAPTSDAFGPAAASGFGKPSAFGQPAGQPSAFGQQSALGQPSTVSQPTAFGQRSAFGKPATLGQGTAFGQPSTLGGGQTGFGKPAFGQSGFAQIGAKQPAFGQTGFGQPSGPTAAAAPFGAPSATSPFGQVQGQQQQQQPAPFGKPSGPAGPFGAPPQQPAAPTGFGQPTGATGFGQPSQTASPFGQVQQQQAKPMPFGQPAAGASPFGQPPPQPPPQQPAAPSPFGQPAAPQGVPVPTANVGPRAFLKIDDPQQLHPLPDLQGQTMRDPNTKKLTMWKGRPVNYLNNHPCYLHPQDNKTYVRINFPDGPPDDATLRDSQAKAEEYTPEVEEMYKFYLENGYFKDGVIPSVPPMKDWISFDF